METFIAYVSLGMGSTKPFVECACICEQVIIDKDGVASIIKIVDRFTAEIPENLPNGIPPGFPILVYVRVKSGGPARTGRVTVRARRPDGTFGGKIEAKIEFQAPQHGVHFQSQFHVIKPQNGVYWFDVLWNDEEPLTSFSADVTVKAVRVPVQATGSSPPQQPT